jgi:hypothetical protein
MRTPATPRRPYHQAFPPLTGIHRRLVLKQSFYRSDARSSDLKGGLMCRSSVFAERCRWHLPRPRTPPQRAPGLTTPADTRPDAIRTAGEAPISYQTSSPSLSSSRAGRLEEGLTVDVCTPARVRRGEAGQTSRNKRHSRGAPLLQRSTIPGKTRRQHRIDSLGHDQVSC